MSSTIGTSLRCTVFGQSHSEAIGCVIEGFPAGFKPDFDELRAFMARRAPGHAAWSTPRKEADEFRVLAGLNPDGVTCGAPIACSIENTNTRSQDYDQLRRVPRPGHADYTAQLRYGGHQDVAGGGHFSGRLTAPLCFAGGLCAQLLAAHGVAIGAHLAEVASIADKPLPSWDGTRASQERLAEALASVARKPFPTIDDEAGRAMQRAIEDARTSLDSVGGIIGCAVTGFEAGVGSPMFDGLENLLARALFGIPAVKGLSFGDGFEAARSRGSLNNDPYGLVDGECAPLTNHAGGILGGISTGAPLTFSVAIKPTASIGQKQASVDLEAGRPQSLIIKGRHDPCIAPRAVPVVEAVTALVCLDALITWPPTHL